MKKEYTSIPKLGTGRGTLQLGIRNRVYQGSDHLLMVQSTGYTEEYRRVFYRDILYVVIRRNKRQRVIGIVLVAIMAFICLFRLRDVPWDTLLSLCLPFGIGLIVNLVKGPSCDCYLRTRVQTVALPTPRRVGKVPALFAFLEPKVPAPPGETAAFS